MNLNINEWQEFHLSKLFSIEAGKYYAKDMYADGSTPYCSASAENNGVSKMIDLSADFEGNKIIIGKVGCTAFYQPIPFCATSDVNVLTPLFEMTPLVGLFITTVINKNENYRWNYGRQCRVGDTKNIVIKLPVKNNNEGSPIIDENKTYSEDGYIPDWEYMENYIKTLNYKPLTTSINKVSDSSITTKNWKPFYLHKIFKCRMGNGIDAVLTTDDNPKYNYVSRNSNGNGVVSFVDEIDGELPFTPGTMTMALGGSFLGSCFIQSKPYYTAQNVAVLEEKTPLSHYTKLFIAAIIRKECKIKYQAFGRELNSHFKKDFILKLPAKSDDSGVVIDKTFEFSDDGYIPDWEYMERYIKTLPYSDKI